MSETKIVFTHDAIDLHEWTEKCKNEAASITQSPSEDYLNFHKNLVPWKPH